MPDSSYTDEPPLDSDSRWWSLDVAFERLMVRLRSTTHTLRDLEEALAQGRLRCMVRSIETGERKLVPSAKWIDRIVLRWWPKYGVVAYRRGTGNPGKSFRGWSFFIWSVDFEALWPADPSFPMENKFGPGFREKLLAGIVASGEKKARKNGVNGKVDGFSYFIERR
jgi:hypothetical protein